MFPKSFAEVVGMPLDQAIERVTLKFNREKLVTKESRNGPGLDGLLYTRGDGKPVNKPIKSNRIVLDYTDITRYMADQFEKTDIKWKCRESTITRDGSLYQDYLFDLNVPDPDGQPMIAMALVRSNIAGNPLTIDFGTYRFVCMNGAKIGKTISSLVIRPKMAQEMLESSLKDQFVRSFSQFEEVGLRYKSLADKDLRAELKSMLDNDEVSFSLKRMTIKQLEQDKYISVLPKVKMVDLKADPNAQIRVIKDGSAWDLYNSMTNAATWQTDQYSTRLRRYEQISEAVGV